MAIPIPRQQPPPNFNIGEPDRDRFRHEFDRAFNPYQPRHAHPQSLIWFALRDLIALTDAPQISTGDCFFLTLGEMPMHDRYDRNLLYFDARYEASVGHGSTIEMGLELRIVGDFSAIQLLGVTRFNCQLNGHSIGTAIDIEPELVRGRYFRSPDRGWFESDTPARQTGAELARHNYEVQRREEARSRRLVNHPMFGLQLGLTDDRLGQLTEYHLNGLRDREQAQMLELLANKGTRPVACQGCSNYHGKTYGGNKLICAIHPIGVEDDRCADFEPAEATSES